MNESATDKLIRQLKEENERMKLQLQSGGALPAELDGKKLSEEGSLAYIVRIHPFHVRAEKRKMRAEVEAELRAQLRQNEEQLARQDQGEFTKKVAHTAHPSTRSHPSDASTAGRAARQA